MPDEQRGCGCPRARHRHGTPAAYTRCGCRCVDCRAAVEAYNNRIARLTAYGRWEPLVDAEPSRRRIAALRGAGLGLGRIARLSGVAYTSVTSIVYGRPDGRPPSRRVRRGTEEAILAVAPTLDTLGGGTLVEAVGTARRLQALVWVGHSQTRLSGMLGKPTGAVSKVMSADRVTVATARAVRELYDELWDHPPSPDTAGERISVSRARRIAADRGYAPPLAWDNIDDPAELPTLGNRTPVLRAHAENAAELMGGQGYTRLQTAERLGIAPGTLDTALARARAVS